MSDSYHVCEGCGLRYSVSSPPADGTLLDGWEGTGYCPNCGEKQ